jgi:membrane peptidoglycan carboxypeptidase
MFKKIIIFCCGLASLSIITTVAAYFWFVVYQPGEAIRQENIEKTLSMESPVYYSDAVTKIGVFFQDSHRQYVPYKKLPEYFVKGLVASEDHDFFNHYGVDFTSFTRALIANLKARRIVQGGSTITQQTAKNLFKREGRSIKAKLYELLYALRLEYHYPKEKILEFYANQFYVSGNGHGLGVAARYYFDKEPQDLDLLECAFIVGSVKRPNYYNPFIKKEPESAAQARARAKERTAYVLGRMYDLAMIDPSAYQQAIHKEIPFQQGEMRFQLNTLMDMVRDSLHEPAIEEKLAVHGIENVATSGIRVITTIDRKLQENSLSSVRSELSRLDVRLNGYDRNILQKRYATLPFGSSNDPEIGQFFVAKVREVTGSPQPEIHVSFSRNGNRLGSGAVITESGLRSLLSALAKYQRQRWSEANVQDMVRLLDNIQAGDLVYVSVQDYDPLTSQYSLQLEKYPELQGGSLIMKDGMIQALVGGMDNFYFNRAVMAKRPMGSVVKPLLYAAALQLEWNSLDLLNNTRNMFVFQDTFYMPRPDHEIANNKVSMSWAGVHSENVASVWLLYHLCDRLTPAQFKELLVHLDMARKPGESYSYYKRKVRDEMGILVNKKVLKRAAYEKAIELSEIDLIFAGKQAEMDMLRLFHYEDTYEKTEEGDDETREGKVRRSIIKRSYERIVDLRNELLSITETGNDGSGIIENPAALYFLPSYERSFFRPSLADKLADASFIFSVEYPGGGWQLLTKEDLADYLKDLFDEEREAFIAQVRLDNLLTVETVDLVNSYFESEYQRLSRLPAYEPEVLHSIRDFRTLAGLNYLIALCKEMGVQSVQEPVLSFPLGSNVLSLLEVAGVYEALTSGKAYFSPESDDPGILLIDRIEDSDGTIIYQADIQEKRVIDEQTALAVSDILRNVVQYGTGRYAKRNIRLRSSDPEVDKQLIDLNVRVPVLGKTGTANRFTNSAFAGAVPAPVEEGNGVSLKDGYIIASYVGFDNNRKMVRTTTHITGASGALPVWTKLVNGLIFEKNYGGAVDLADLIFSGKDEMQFIFPDIGQLEIPVAVREGGVAAGTGQKELSAETRYTNVLSFGEVSTGGRLELTRYFRPFWHHKAPRSNQPSELQ